MYALDSYRKAALRLHTAELRLNAILDLVESCRNLGHEISAAELLTRARQDEMECAAAYEALELARAACLAAGVVEVPASQARCKALDRADAFF